MHDLMLTTNNVASACNPQLHDRATDDQEQCAVQQLAVKTSSSKYFSLKSWCTSLVSSVCTSA